ncbi:WXG100 family type VII secretion target [Streptomyces sp. NPDC002573]|uniref:WXG100 family type VII secretion target n=1 Tax=Streptomyces sp. NPDC002573 TaxID=3364651 RepID=UPI0036B5D801
MTTQYSMKFQSVDTVIADLFAANAQIQQQLDQLDSNVKALIARWSGDAVQHYYPLQLEWNNACKGLSDTLNSSGRVLEQVAQNTKTTELKNAAMFTFGR